MVFNLKIGLQDPLGRKVGFPPCIHQIKEVVSEIFVERLDVWIMLKYDFSKDSSPKIKMVLKVIKIAFGIKLCFQSVAIFELLPKNL